MISRVVRACAAGAVVLGVAVTSSCARPAPTPPVGVPTPTPAAIPAPASTAAAVVVPPGEFAAVSQAVNDDIAEHRLPGAVVQVGHAGKVILRQAYGARRLASEPGLDGLPGPAEPMTVDTIFDLASLTKIIVTTTAILQLYEQGRVRLDEPVQTYLPDFNPGEDPRRARVTLRMLLTHTSGIGGDLSRQGPWGLSAADRADGLHRALTAPLEFDPGVVFHYSDIGFILLGTIVERLSGQPLDVYAHDRIFTPLGMTDTAYLPAAQACGPHRIIGNALALDASQPAGAACPNGSWSTGLLARVAPTARDEDTPGVNPNIDRLLRGTVHDPTARRMGGVTGSAGVFSTAQDVGRYAQALLDRLAGRPSPFPLSRSTLELMTTPQQPAAAGPDLRGLGWDIDTYQSTPRGTIFPVGSFGHTGFTGVTVWLDPGSDSYIVVLANVIHQRGGPPVVELSGEIATASAQALHLYGS
ncbi:MAG: beta-lactamase family protein [Mycobacterium sp.]|nr:beta-lactamase family protein [Mycobacterium sp.]